MHQSKVESQQADFANSHNTNRKKETGKRLKASHICKTRTGITQIGKTLTGIMQIGITQTGKMQKGNMQTGKT